MTDRNETRRKVAEFQKTFQTPGEPAFWLELIREETEEFKAAYAHAMKELADLIYVLAGAGNAATDETPEQLTEEQKDILREAMRVVSILEDNPVTEYDTLAPVIDAVHASNMSKVDDSGNPVRDPETGKIQKGPNYQAPDIETLIFG